ncbi:MAG: hypothetical protein HY822_24190 [Acidobacteria bacterium]|nr:hypothetical protein [Acidobacteriota bacterium]
MTRERKAQAVTVAILAIALGGIAVFRSGWKPPKPPAEPKPQDAVYAMLDAAREGNVQKYLGAYTGQMEVSLRQTIAESGEAAFAKYLRESNAAIKGVAVMEPQPLSDREVKLKVEYVYQDRNEVQLVCVEKTAGAWRIARVDSAERIKTLIPYGTPVQ